MAKNRMDEMELLGKEAPEADLDFLREGLRALMQAVMGTEVTTVAGLSERSLERITYTNGYRARPWGTRVGTLGLLVQKVREAATSLPCSNPRRRRCRSLLLGGYVEAAGVVPGQIPRRHVERPAAVPPDKTRIILLNVADLYQHSCLLIVGVDPAVVAPHPHPVQYVSRIFGNSQEWPDDAHHPGEFLLRALLPELFGIERVDECPLPFGHGLSPHAGKVLEEGGTIRRRGFRQRCSPARRGGGRDDGGVYS